MRKACSCCRRQIDCINTFSLSLSRLLEELDEPLLLVPFFKSSPRLVFELLLDLLWWDDDDDFERLDEDDDDLDEELFEPPPDFPFSSFFLSGVEGLDDEFAEDDDEFFDFDEDDEEVGSDLWIISPNKFLNWSSLFFVFEVSGCKNSIL